MFKIYCILCPAKKDKGEIQGKVRGISKALKENKQ